MMRKSPYVLLVLATCIWGGNFVVGKALVVHIPPLQLAALRWGVAFLGLAPFLGREAWKHRDLFLRNWKTVLFLSATGVAGFNTLTYVAVQYTSSINASLMNAATPILVVVLGGLMTKERIAWPAIPGILVSMAGVLWIIGRGSLTALMGLSFNRGDLWMLLAVLLWSLYSIGTKKAAGLFPASPLLLVQVAVSMPVLIALAAAEHAVVEADWSSGSVLSLTAGILYVGLFASIAAFLSWNKAIELAGPQRCAGFLNLIPLFSALFAVGFRGESLHLYHILGGVLIILGVYVTNRTVKKLQLSAASAAAASSASLK